MTEILTPLNGVERSEAIAIMRQSNDRVVIAPTTRRKGWLVVSEQPVK